MDENETGIAGTDRARELFGDGRLSRQRRVIADCVDDIGRAFSVDELADAARARTSGIATATVYRAVGAMVDSGSLRLVGRSEGAALYFACGVRDEHHHHAVCERCGTVLRVECPLGETTLERLAAEGLTVTRHEVRLYGLCEDCAARGDGAGSRA